MKSFFLVGFLFLSVESFAQVRSITDPFGIKDPMRIDQSLDNPFCMGGKCKEKKVQNHTPKYASPVCHPQKIRNKLKQLKNEIKIIESRLETIGSYCRSTIREEYAETKEYIEAAIQTMHESRNLLLDCIGSDWQEDQPESFNKYDKKVKSYSRRLSSIKTEAFVMFLGKIRKH